MVLTGCDLADNAAEDISTQDSFLVERAQLNELDEDMFHGQFDLRGDWPTSTSTSNTIFRRFED